MKKNKIFILADDLTGASELGGIALQFGLSVKILFYPEQIANLCEDVVIMDSNSRNLEPREAYERITALTSGIDFSSFKLIYKKVDSVLRGSISSEVDAFTKILNRKSTLLIPANPSKKRIIRNGKYFIDELPLHYTEFRFDPGFPRFSNDVKDMVTDNTGNVFTDIDHKHPCHNKIILPDIPSIMSLKKIANTLKEKEILPGGGGDFFKEILSEKYRLSEKVLYSKIKLNKTPFVIGSNSLSSRRTVKTLGKKGYTVFRLPKSAIDNNIKFEEWLEKILQAMDNGIPVAISGPVQHLKDPEQIAHTREKIVKTAQKLAHKIPKEQRLMMEGGETASGFFRGMQLDELLISEVYGPGIIELKNQAETIKVVIKPGSYPWPENALEQLN